MFLLLDLSRNVVLNFIKFLGGEEKDFCVCMSVSLHGTHYALIFHALRQWHFPSI